MKYIEEDKKEKDIIKIKSDLVLTKKALRIKGWMKPKS
mgnify:FL=1